MSATRSQADRTNREILAVVCLGAVASALLDAIGAYSHVATAGLVTLAVGLGVVLLRRPRRDLAPTNDLQLFSHTSHQIRSPLTIARGHAELLRGVVSGTVPQQHVEIILQELDRASKLADRMLVLAAADDPDFLVPIEAGIDTVVIEAATRWRSTADRRWAVDCADDHRFTADVTRIMVAIDALVENAVAHTDSGDEILIAGSVQGGMATFEVRDTGRGMSRRDVDGLVSSLREGRRPRYRRPGGTGLGLQIARAVVDAHGGWLSLASEAGTGSTFTLHVPMATTAIASGGGRP
jgi:signal transduction histidine kinase